ncbi:DUF1499 domain-containing protein [Lysobacter sp. M2-1]|uniref:DUF1499 domain-containing protein n=1 Tax=Lysobacter sp. M2-1 TaxID=2916839 RepID=UPI001F592264|nr:DUF1499 domain-containing protein [Lysobacter sp. M2-1]
MKPAHIAFLLSLIAAVLLLAAGPGTRLELWEFRTGFALMRWAAFAGLAAAALAIVMLLVPRTRRTGSASLLAALVLGLGVAFVPWNGMRQARAVPPIHDISTDTERPPEFVAVLPLRADAPNPAAYGGAEVAQAQREGYPDLGPLRMDLPPPEAFAKAEQVARDMGWEIVAADPATGRIEATDTTLWFGFKDDIVIRVEADGEGSRVDMRSVSRVGKSDVGTNAKRIRAYLQALGSR